MGDDGLVAELITPRERGVERGAVVVLGGSGGGIPGADAASFAGEGFAALAVAYFGVAPLPPQLAEVPVETVKTALDWLIAHRGGRGDRVALTGRSKGGELALLAAATYPGKVNAVIGYVPSPVVWQGLAFDPLGRPRRTSSWTIGGEPVHWLPFGRPRPAEMASMMGRLTGRPATLRPFYERALDDREAVDQAMIPLENIDGPVLLISGSGDQVWPSTLLCDLATRRLADSGRRYSCEHLRYEGAGHMIGPWGASSHAAANRWLRFGGSEHANASATADAWPRVLNVLAASAADVAERRDG